MPTPSPAVSDDDLFDKASATEESNPVASVELYRQALAVNPKHVGAYTNLGRLLHARRQYDDAEAVYRQGLAHCGHDATLLFNLAIVLEDAHRPADAADMYREALKEAPDLPEAHYNLALLCEVAGLKQEAIRHLSAYRKLSKR